MYDYRNSKEYMKKSTSEKLMVNFNMFDERVPSRLVNGGSGNWKFQFTKNYTLLVYYNLIQFRNYQAANFNILFLVFACYILQRYLDQMFHFHLAKVVEIVYRNFQMKKKSDDYELFLGKQGKNVILGPVEKVKIFQDWASQVLKYNLDHVSPLFEQDNFENLMDTDANIIQGNSDKVERNLGFLGTHGSVLLLNLKLNELVRGKASVKEVTDQMKQISLSKEGDEKITDFNTGIALYMLAEAFSRHDIHSKFEALSIIDMQDCL